MCHYMTPVVFLGVNPFEASGWKLSDPFKRFKEGAQRWWGWCLPLIVKVYSYTVIHVFFPIDSGWFYTPQKDSEIRIKSCWNSDWLVISYASIFFGLIKIESPVYPRCHLSSILQSHPATMHGHPVVIVRWPWHLGYKSSFWFPQTTASRPGCHGFPTKRRSLDTPNIQHINIINVFGIEPYLSILSNIGLRILGLPSSNMAHGEIWEEFSSPGADDTFAGQVKHPYCW